MTTPSYSSRHSQQVLSKHRLKGWEGSHHTLIGKEEVGGLEGTLVDKNIRSPKRLRWWCPTQVCKQTEPRCIAEGEGEIGRALHQNLINAPGAVNQLLPFQEIL